MRKIQSSAAGERRQRPQPKQAVKSKAAGTSGGKRPGKRFVEPVRLDGALRGAIIDTLESAGIGDASGREIFVGALGYDLAKLLKVVADGSRAPRAVPSRSAKAEQARPEVTSTASAEAKALGQLADAARSLHQCLTGLNKVGRERLTAALRETDRLARDHGSEYLAAMHAELTHLSLAAAQACRGIDAVEGAAQSKPRAPAKPAKSSSPAEDAMVAFVRHVARVYSQCLEQPPTPKANAPFAQVLRIIAEQSDVPLAVSPAILRQALERPTAG